MELPMSTVPSSDVLIVPQSRGASWALWNTSSRGISCALGELQGFCHFAFLRQVNQVCTSSCLAPRLPGEPKCLSSWWDQESSSSYLPLILKFILQISVAMESCLEWLSWTLLSFPLKKFPSHLSVCPPQLVSGCWVSLFGPVLLKQVHRGAGPRFLAHQGKAQLQAHSRKLNWLFISFILLMFYTHHLVKGGGGGGCLLPSFLLAKWRCMEMT